VDIHKAERQRAAALQQNRFEKLRHLPTRREHEASLAKWHRGVTFPYDLAAKGLPVVQLSSEQSSVRGAASNLVRDKPAYYEVGKTRNGNLKTLVGKQSLEQQFWEYMAAIKLRSAVASLGSNAANTANNAAPSTYKHPLLTNLTAKIHPTSESSLAAYAKDWWGKKLLDVVNARMTEVLFCSKDDVCGNNEGVTAGFTCGGQQR